MSRPPRTARAHGPPPWFGRRWHGERPPWWPQNEEWPPRGRWHGPSRRFAARLALTALAVLLLIDLALALVASLIARALGIVALDARTVLVLAAALVLFVLGVSVLGRGLRRAGAPLADLAAAIDRVAEGEYTTRVSVRGPREIRRLVAAFNEMVERLATADERRRRLLADVTHELRTPLAVVQGQLEGTLDGVYPPDAEHLRAILDETRHMARIIEDLRTLSLAESGALTLSRETVTLGDVVDDALDAYRMRAETGGVCLAGDVPPDLPPIDADPTRLRQVLENLLANALRYTPRGGRVDVTAMREGTAMVAIAVRDTGRGMGPQELARAFERFARSDDPRGTGLGLAIARGLVRAHGGEIAISSEGEGRGTTVRSTWPVAR
ncbi:MAG: HAMP domain-containing histidine kinase [Chloroflexota bacterium]|nr:HAMP domain-containing histidine kinase [Chloroflexota bacterium]MDE3101854.1 HAMP domain-containing histidine kinase [Chloroflexota bacterium]